MTSAKTIIVRITGNPTRWAAVRSGARDLCSGRSLSSSFSLQSSHTAWNMSLLWMRATLRSPLFAPRRTTTLVLYVLSCRIYAVLEWHWKRADADSPTNRNQYTRWPTTPWPSFQLNPFYCRAVSNTHIADSAVLNEFKYPKGG